MTYLPTWNALRQHPTPAWFQNAKFGIYTHWGVYSVPACRPNGPWYPYNMYREGTEQYEYHKKTYGDPSVFGYKDFIPMFTGEKFDADEWAELFKQSGAQYAGPVGEHHDGFTMWDTKYSPWNAAKMGPKTDVVGALERAIRAQGMKYMVALHHAENWFFFPHWNKQYDTSDARFAGLYGEAHDLGRSGNTPENYDWRLMDKPSKTFLDLWLNKGKELIDRYSPDMLWFDFGLAFIQEHYKRELLSHYFNHAQKNGQDVLVTYKNNDLAAGCGIVDLELGRFDRLQPNEWITDTTVDDGQGWGYLFDAQYKLPASLIHYLIDNVSKNGHMLLNVGPTPQGEIPAPAKDILRRMGRWLAVNGEAIYGTTPWLYDGEGPTRVVKPGAFNEDQQLTYCAQDIRYTAKDDTIYAIGLAWPKEHYLFKTLASLYPGEIARVSMLGTDEPLCWKMTDEGLRVAVPKDKPCEDAFVVKIERRPPFEGA